MQPKNNHFKVAALLILAASAAMSMRGESLEQISVRDLGRKESKFERRLYTASLVAISAGTAADMASSFKFTSAGQKEANGFLASGGGYGSKGALIEAGAVGASLLLQHFMLKNHPHLRLAFTVSNFAFASFQAYNVHHNLTGY